MTNVGLGIVVVVLFLIRDGYTVVQWGTGKKCKKNLIHKVEEFIHRVSCVADSSPTVQVACSGRILLFCASLCGWQAGLLSAQATVQLQDAPIGIAIDWLVPKHEDQARSTPGTPGPKPKINCLLNMFSQSCCPYN